MPEVASPRVAEEGPVTWRVPGAGGRAVQVRVETSLAEAFEGELVDRWPAPLPAPDELFAALRGRSLVLIVADALHAAHLHCYGAGRETSPVLDQLAAEGVAFERAFSQTSWTVPSVTSLFVGLEQERHGVRDVGLALDRDGPLTLAEAFSRSGYHTAALLENAIIGAQTQLDRGFDSYQVFADQDLPAFQRVVLEWLRDPPAEPFFLYLHYLPPHEPYQPPAPYAGRYGAGPGADLDGSPRSIAAVNQQQPTPSHPGVVLLRDLYDSHVQYLDARVGEVMQLVRERQAAGPAVVFSADHGEAFGQHGFIGHNLHVYQEMVHVPLIFWAAGVPALRPRRVSAAVSLLDVFPTLAELFGLGPTAPTSGTSLLGLLEGQEAAGERLLFLSARHALPGRRGVVPFQRSVVAGALKLVENVPQQSTQLFDLAADPAEQVDISTSHPLVAEALERELREWLEGLPSTQPAVSVPLTPELSEHLRALGYLGDEAAAERR